MENLSEFYERGFQVVGADNQSALDDLREKIFNRAKSLTNSSQDNSQTFFDDFHTLGLNGARLNDLRMKVIEYCTHEIDTSELLFQSFEKKLQMIVGTDVAVQKNMNIVIQQPNDPDCVPVHRDAPPNSPFEVVVWVPLVDCFETKGMYIADKTDTDLSTSQFDGTDEGYEKYRKMAEQKGEKINVPYGSAAFMWAGLAHGCLLNKEATTRWSLNIRYKNLFSPYGYKGIPDFFRALRVSPLARLGFDYEMNQGEQA